MLIVRRSKPTKNFTILPNELLRDDRLSYCARGILGELLSRPEGWEVNADTLSDRARRHRGDIVGEGRRGMRAAFAELEETGYMVRRKEKGTKGRFVTVLEVFDTPQDRGTARGTSANGTSVGGTSASGTSSRSTEGRRTEEEDDQRRSLSPPLPEQRTAEPAAAPAEERETISASQDKLSTAQRLVRAASVVSVDEEPAFIAWLTARHQPNGPGWWRMVARNGDFGDHAAAWRTERRPAAPTAPATPAARPDWCGDLDCDEIDRQRERELPDGIRVNYPCPNCHPDTAPTWASKPAKRSGGHQPYKDPTDPSVWDLGFDGKPLPGRQLSTPELRVGQAFAVSAELRAEEDAEWPASPA